MNFFDLSLRLNGYPIHKAKKALKEIIELNDDAFQDYVEERKNHIVDFHLKNNSFYKEFGKYIDQKNCVPLVI